MKGNSVTKPTAARKNSAAITAALKAAVESNGLFVVCIPVPSLTEDTEVDALSVTFIHGGTSHDCSTAPTRFNGYLLIVADAPTSTSGDLVDSEVKVSFSVNGVSFSRTLEAILYPAQV